MSVSSALCSHHQICAFSFWFLLLLLCLYAVDLSCVIMPHDTQRHTVLLLQEPFRGTLDDFAIVDKRTRVRQLGKWNLPMSLQTTLTSMCDAPGHVVTPAGAGSIRGICVCACFDTIAHPADLACGPDADVYLALRDYYFRARKLGLHALLWSTVRDLIVFDEPLVDPDQAFQSMPRRDMHDLLVLSNPSLRRPGTLQCPAHFGLVDGSVMRALDYFKDKWPALSIGCWSRGTTRLPCLQMPWPWLRAVLERRVAVLTCGDLWFSIRRASSGVGTVRAPVRNYPLRNHVTGHRRDEPPSSATGVLLLSMDPLLFASAASMCRHHGPLHGHDEKAVL